MKLVIVPTNVAKNGTNESVTTAKPPSINIGMTGTKKILASGETIGNNPEKYIVYGNMNSGRPQARIRSSRTFTLL